MNGAGVSADITLAETIRLRQLLLRLAETAALLLGPSGRVLVEWRRMFSGQERSRKKEEFGKISEFGRIGYLQKMQLRRAQAELSES